MIILLFLLFVDDEPAVAEVVTEPTAIVRQGEAALEPELN